MRAEERQVSWLPQDKSCAVCFSVDDVHPGTSDSTYEAGGDLDLGVFGRLRHLQLAHPELHTTLFVTPAWRLNSPDRTRFLLSGIPLIRDYVYWSSVRPRSAMRLDRHVRFVEYLRSLERVEIGVHGLHHCRRGPNLAAEFKGAGPFHRDPSRVGCRYQIGRIKVPERGIRRTH